MFIIEQLFVLKDYGITDITIGEGIVAAPKDTETPTHAFHYLGYETLKQRYGFKYLNVMARYQDKPEFDESLFQIE